jgi:hypothetical protein
MKIFSLNLRGWGKSNSLIKKGAFDMCLLQETKRAHFLIL